jgi:hypothetical protein
LRLSAGRIKDLAKRIENASAWVSDEAVAKLKGLDASFQAAARAETLAAEDFRSNDNLLPGTGEPVWKTLFEAARKFSTEAAYPGYVFPHTAADALCPLCQQVLRDGADRLKRFTKYVEEDAAKVASEKRRQIEAARTKIQGANIAIGLDEPLAAEIAILDDTVTQVARAFESAVALRRASMLNATATHSWEEMPTLTENPRRRLRDLAARQLKSARTFERASNESKRQQLILKRNELNARKNLAVALNAVLALVDRFKLKTSLEQCKDDLKTRRISDKSKELASNAVTSALKTALDDEFKTLGIAHIGTKLKERNDKGKMKYRLLLNLPTTHKLDEILSEGEQRAIGLFPSRNSGSPIIQVVCV